MLKKTPIILSVLVGIFTFAPTFADNQNPTLNIITLRLQAQQWATTQTAKVIININASMQEHRLGEFRQHVLQKLQKIATGEWHVTQFSPSKGESGLEQVYAVAEARIPEKMLTNIQGNAKAMSQPGENYTVAAVQFTPSQQEIEQVRAALRQQIYEAAQAELAKVNQIYTDEKFYLHTINFNEEPSIPPHPQIMMLREAAPNGQIAVSEKITLNAQVELAADFSSQSNSNIKTIAD